MAENQSRRRKAARATRPERVRHGPGKARGAGGKGGPADIRPVGPFRRIIGILLILGGVGLTAGAVVGAIVDPAPRAGDQQGQQGQQVEQMPVVPVEDDSADLSVPTPHWLAEEGEHAVAAPDHARGHAHGNPIGARRDGKASHTSARPQHGDARRRCAG